METTAAEALAHHGHRMKSGQRASVHNNNFDLLRLLAAAQVVAMHASEWLRLPAPPDILTLFPGVPVFFVISGFLITGSYIGRRQSLHDYARNRILRVYPGMTINLALIFVLMVVTGAITLDALGDPKIYTYFAAIAATGWTKLGGVLAGSKSFTFGPDTLPFFPGGALWTVGVEIGFYILVPLIMGLPWRRLALVFAASLGLAVAQNWLQSSWIDTTIPVYLWIFMLGAGARLAWDRVGWLFRQTFPIWLALHLLLWTVPDYKNPTLLAILSVLTLAGCSLSFAHTLPRISSVLRRQFLRRLSLSHAGHPHAALARLFGRRVALGGGVRSDIRHGRAVLVSGGAAGAHLQAQRHGQGYGRNPAAGNYAGRA